MQARYIRELENKYIISIVIYYTRFPSSLTSSTEDDRLILPTMKLFCQHSLSFRTLTYALLAAFLTPRLTY